MKTILYMDDLLFRYGFPNHPLTPKRYQIFRELFYRSKLSDRRDIVILGSKVADEDTIKLFHTEGYVRRVRELSIRGYGLLDYGDTPAYPGVYEVAASGVYATCDAVKRVYSGDIMFAVNFAGGWHHARRERAGGFCVFNDIGVSIEYLKSVKEGVKIYYVDIDAHHGDGVYYSFEADPDVYIFDIHESGYFLYPGTGFEHEVGVGEAVNTKRNIALSPNSGDDELLRYIEEAYEFGYESQPDLIILQGGLDGLEGDPLTHLRYSVDGYLRAVRRIFELAINLGIGLVFLGGGGYQPDVVARTWLRILELLVNM
jgi:acetoin utilization protein AcuC